MKGSKRYFLVSIILLQTLSSFCVRIEEEEGKKKIEKKLVKPVKEKGLFSEENLQKRRDVVFAAMDAELQRSFKNIFMKGFEPPYFILYRITDINEYNIAARLGSLLDSDVEDLSVLYVETRVGSYQSDNSSDKEYSYNFGNYGGYSTRLPIDLAVDGIRHRLWLLTDASYKRALSDYLQRKGESAISIKSDEDVGNFSKEKAVVHISRFKPFQFDLNKWEDIARRVSDVFRKYPQIEDSYFSLKCGIESKYIRNTEGARIFDQIVYYYIKIYASSIAEDGMPLNNIKTFFITEEKELPDEKRLIGEAERVAEELVSLKRSKEMEPYTGPAILSPQVAGVFFHEVIGHRLEGERQRFEKEGMTFKSKVGEKILPDFISVYDDPTQREYNSKALSGYYEIDDEGIPAQRVVLVEKGVLKGFLMSRMLLRNFRNSNGHGRADENSKPMARMSNLIVKSDVELNEARLKELLIDELKKQNKEFGFILKSVTSGETNTSRYGFQAFKGTPILVYKIYAKDGREELIRGVDIVGTPLTVLNKIIAAGDDYDVFNGLCGAESGYIPVSTVAPSILISEIELQRKSTEKKRPPLLPPPL